jgi:WD40 repeat protein
VTATQPARPEAGVRWSHLAGASALLVGTGTHTAASALPDVPAIGRTLTDLREVLVERCGLDRAAVQLHLDPATPVDMGEAVAAAAERAGDRLLLLYFVGHGLVSTSGQLYLATQGTDRRPNRVSHTALSYAIIREYLLETAGPRVVLLDCCFSGRAVDTLGDFNDDVASLAEITGGFVLTSAGRDELALAPAGALHTAFSGALLRLLRDGDPDGQPDFTLDDVHRYLARTLPAAGLPRPQCRSTGRVGDLVVASNPAFQTRSAHQEHTGILRAASASRLRSQACPYKGLAPFGTADSSWFFGRERLTEILLRRLAERSNDGHPMVVMGASGSGKSSLLRAGLSVALSRGDLRLPGSVSWPRLLFTPTADPVGSLAAEVARLAGVPAEQIAAQIRTAPNRLAGLLRQLAQEHTPGHAPGSARVVLLVDQFEETFTLCADEDERRLFIRALCAAADGNDHEQAALVVLGVRADFYGHCAAYPQLLTALERLLVVGPMTTSELRFAIQRPAAAVGLALEPGLVEVLLTDLGVRHSDHDGTPDNDGSYEPGRLPLLSHALLATWQQREGSTLTAAGYRRAGGIHGALAATADRVMAELSATEQRTARRLLLRLVHLGDGTEDTRRRVDRSQLIQELPDASSAARVLDAFAADNARLVTVDQDTVEITHEALLRAWPVLKEWIEADRAGHLIAQQLVEAAHAWDRDARDPTGLYRGTRLALARDWAADSEQGAGLGKVAQAFLEASIRQERTEQDLARRHTRRLRRLNSGLVLLVTVTLVTAVVAIQQRNQAQEQRDQVQQQHQIATSTAVVKESIALYPHDPPTALLLGVAAMRIAATSEARSNLIDLTARNRLSTVRTAHRNSVDKTIISPNGRILVSATASEPTVRLWDLQRRTPLSTLPGRRGGALDLAFSPDGRTLAIGSDKPELWDVQRRRRLATLPTRQTGALAFSPDGRILATALFSRVQLWDVRRRALMATIPDMSGGGVAFSPDGETLAISTADHGVRLWDVRRRTLEATLFAQAGLIYEVAFSPDGRTLAAGTPARGVQLWDVRRRVLLGTVVGSTRGAAQMAFSPDGRTLATGSGSFNGIELWDVKDRGRLETLTADINGVGALAFSPDGTTVVSGNLDGTMGFWDLGRTIFSANMSGFSPDGKLLATSGDTVRLWNARQGTLTATLPVDGSGPPIFSPDGHTLAVANENGVHLWNVRRRGSPTTIPVPDFPPGGGPIAFSPDGSLLATGGDKTVRLWNLANHKVLTTLRGHTYGVMQMEFTPDGQTLVTVGMDETIRLWDLKRHSQASVLRIPKARDKNKPSMAITTFSPDGRTLATVSFGGVLQLWDTERRSLLATLAGHTQGTKDIWAIAFSPDGGTLAGAGQGKTIRLWDVSRHTERASLTGPADGMHGLAFSPDGHMLAGAGHDGSVRLWDVGQLTQLALLTGRVESGSTSTLSGKLAFSPDGRTLASEVTSSNPAIQLWDTDPQQAIRRICSEVGRDLSRQQWLRFVPGLPYRSSCS